MRPELLAPAGSIESFHAAVEAGANAVYLGLTDFNARLRAKNFTAATLSYLVPYAHKHHVRLYVAFNTLVKQAELEPVVHALYRLEQIGVDALIIADRGVIDIAQKHFPRLRLHASTQMAVHNAAGARAAGRLGIKRVILSRELTVDEIRAIKKQAAVELEVFVHGALCYSVSGLCLASSFLGGSSGSRGRCTQVCRRKFVCGDASAPAEGFFFSPNDLCAASFLPDLVRAGVAAFKIEGRMKNAAYVYAVVNAYRKALDGEVSIEEAQELLANDLGREKTTFFLGGVKQQGVITAAIRSGIGEIIGCVIEAVQDRIVVAPHGAQGPALSAGDRIRIQPESGFDGTAAEVQQVSHEAGRMCLRLKSAVECGAGDAVFLVGRGSDSARFDRRGVEGVEPVRFLARCPFVNNILRNCRGVKAVPRRGTLWIKIDTVGWLDLLAATPCQRMLFAGGRPQLDELIHDKARLNAWRSRLVVCLPPFIPESETGAWRQLLDRCGNAGITRGGCSNIGHAEIFPQGFELIADTSVGCLNCASQRALRKNGFTAFVYSSEDDYLNIKASASADGSACLFVRVPLFISRIRPAVRTGAEVRDPNGDRFLTAEAHGLFYLLSKKTFCVTHRRRKLSEAGIRDHLLDLSFCSPDPALLSSLLESCRNGTRVTDTSLFNFKAGLK
jgi:U32 family peptidase